jgi:hypothetical protein
MAEKLSPELQEKRETSFYFRSDALAVNTTEVFGEPPEVLYGAWRLAGFKTDKAYSLDDIKEAIRNYNKHGGV